MEVAEWANMEPTSSAMGSSEMAEMAAARPSTMLLLPRRLLAAMFVRRRSRSGAVADR